MMIRSDEYYKIRLTDYSTVGGIILAPQGESCYVKRMFLHPDYQNQGIGEYVLNYMEQLYNTVTKWHLDTPKDNVRTNHFYEKCGYEIEKTVKHLNYYVKNI